MQQRLFGFNHDGSFNAAVTNKIMSKRLERVERAVIPGIFWCRGGWYY